MGLLGTVLNNQQRVQFIQNGTNTLIQLDASVKENHSRESTPTEFPVENGDTISDHVIVKPFNLEITGIISDSPIGGVSGLLTEVATTLTSALLPPVGVIAGGVGAALFSALSKSDSPSVANYNALLKLQAGAMPFDVLTSLYHYKNMWIKNLSVPREAETGNVLMFTVTLTQLLLVSPQAVNVQIFANPGLASAQANTGQNGLELSAKYQQGFTDANTGVHTVAGGTIAGGN